MPAAWFYSFDIELCLIHLSTILSSFELTLAKTVFIHLLTVSDDTYLSR